MYTNLVAYSPTTTFNLLLSRCILLIPFCREIPHGQIQFVNKVGECRFSSVWKGTLYGLLPVTIKISKPSYARQSHEAAQLLVLKHPNLIELYGICSTRAPMYTILEYMKHGCLTEYLQGEGQSLKFPQLIKMASQIASGMSYLEQHNTVHRDLAAKNVLVKENLVCKVANFELAQNVRGGEHLVPLGMDQSYKWAAPECILYDMFTIKSDVWSFGIVLYEIVTYGRSPYSGLTNTQVQELIRQGGRMSRSMYCPEKLYDVMLNCWKEEPVNRPTFETLQWQLEDFFTS